MLQQIAWLLSLALMLLVARDFTFVALKSGRRANDYTPMQVRAYLQNPSSYIGDRLGQ